MHSRRRFFKSIAAFSSLASLNFFLSDSKAKENRFVPLEKEFDSYAERSRHVMQLANQEAQRLNHDYVGVKHLLGGLFHESQRSNNWLSELNVEVTDIRDVIRCLMGEGTEMVLMGKPAQSENLKICLSASVNIANRLKHHSVRPEHLLMAILETKKNSAVLILDEMWIDKKSLHQLASSESQKNERNS